jgi:inorganic pyrophosphatase
MSDSDQAAGMPEDPFPDSQAFSPGTDAVIKVLVQVEAGSRERRLYDEKNLVFIGTRQVAVPYPYPYGFIVGTSGEDGDNLDCYIITQDRLKAGEIVACRPIGVLEQEEGDEIDHKVLAALPGQRVDLNPELLGEMRAFISALNVSSPDWDVRVGRIRSREEALNYIQSSLETDG